ncbi:hypothetical protein [Paenibacillus tuaregi]|uniref:hypothetical protein n=1 Tax=Paenibacillus tuaregi TaxID=1816681 RepID=UPI000838B3AF|nr:hypothetical protein [Paenibacillus tuaregi]
MTDAIYVILIDERPYRKDGAIRTYKTRERAEKEARKVARYWSYRDCTFSVARFAVVEREKIAVEPYKDRAVPAPYSISKEDA